MFGRLRGKHPKSADWFRCEGCGEIAQGDGAEAMLAVCGACGYHGPLGAQAHLDLLCDPGSFSAEGPELRPVDPLGFRGKLRYRDELKAAQKQSQLVECVLMGGARVGGKPVVVAASESAFLGGTLGAVGGESIARAFELGAAEQIPVVLVLSSAGFRRQEGVYAAAIMARMVTQLAVLRRAGATLIVIGAGHVRGAAALVGASADVFWCEPGVRVSWGAGDGHKGVGAGSVMPRSEQREQLVSLVRAIG
ncbi:MAG: hypothetical protein JRH20_18655 [Deltaproteobacteria bacterium]|nr:hypothetical protein [Deltaproteobacteria bacterium]